MRARFVALALLALLAGACASDRAASDRAIPGMGDDRRVEQINTTDSRLESK